jgi:type IV pilus assembly protein PilC
MVFSSRIPLPALIAWCRALRHGLHAGLSPVKILRQQAKSGPVAVRGLAGTLAERLKSGDSFEDALKEHRPKFPLLFLELVTVGEKAGKLSETFEELEKYFTAQQDARKKFLQAITWPAFMYVAAVVVIAILVTVLALLGGHIDPLGLGFLGPAAGLVVLVLGGGFAAFVTVAYLIARDNENLKQWVEAIGIRIPGLMGAYRSFALQRFSLALGMTHESGMRADQALALSFRATANLAYLKHGEPAAKSVRGGKTIAKTLTAIGGGLFPDEFLDVVQIGESTGQLSEVMARQAEQYGEEASRRIRMLAMVLGGLVYALVGLMVVVMIIRIAMVAYINPLNDALKMNGF